ncbi:MAG: hypothetical protein A3C35_07905 [Omnitrophica bacterium RIFCSPHIGHO2_02_FULL_46_11]|nr:MAG: hypothetical protein A3C35_07905 [Omnitrophica bacterium RIFCSPHIGHO2_02_FULL_46_11]OGW87280.1 MAG: hypothetical protein A3A81_03695 [Omnitrophica bacterium RIFCSPLOWO2_01_FULL_45_10b]
MAHHRSFISQIKKWILIYGLSTILIWTIYYQTWGKHLYLITAYCNCPICINVKKYHDGRFASGKKVYWGALAADPSIPFRTKVELMPLWPQDWAVIFTRLKGRRNFKVEDRGGKIKGKHIDLFIPDSLGGHKAARRWGARRMRLKINGEWAD